MMTRSPYQSYDEAAADYMSQFNSLLQAPPAAPGRAVRGSTGIAAEDLMERADKIADISASMNQLSKNYFADPDPLVREGISGQLLAQAAAELQMASELMQIAEAGDTVAAARVTRGAVHATRLPDAIHALENVMDKPLSSGLDPFMQVRRAARVVPASVEEAKSQLKQSAVNATASILQWVTETGGDIASGLVFQTPWTSVLQGASLVSKSFAELLDAAKEGLGGMVARAAAVVTRTLLNVYEKILAVLGKGAADTAREKVRDWLESVKKDGKIEVFDSLVEKWYRVEDFKKDMAVWIDQSARPLDDIASTKDKIDDLAQKFTVLRGRIARISDVAGLAMLLKTPQIALGIVAIRVILLGALVYSGYDYIGYSQARLPNWTRGIAEVMRDGLLAPGGEPA